MVTDLLGVEESGDRAARVLTEIGHQQYGSAQFVYDGRVRRWRRLSPNDNVLLRTGPHEPEGNGR